MDSRNYVEDFQNALQYRSLENREEIEYYRHYVNGDDSILIQYFNEVMESRGHEKLDVSESDVFSPPAMPDWYIEARSELAKDFWFPNLNLGAIKDSNRQALRALSEGESIHFRQCANELLIDNPAQEPYLVGLFEVYQPATYTYGLMTMVEKGSGFNPGVIEVHFMHSGHSYDRSALEAALRSEAYDGKPLTKKSISFG